MDLSLNEYRTIVETAPNLIWRANLEGQCDYFNKTWLDFTGRSLKQELGNGWLEGVHPEDQARCMEIYLEHFKHRTPFEMEYRLHRLDGAWRWINDRGVPIWDSEGAFAGYIGSCLDVTENVEGHAFKELSQKDGLTGICNRQYLMSLFAYRLEAAKQAGEALTVAMMDVDKFKAINDRYGHLTGDSALKMFASVVKDKIRDDDLFGRYGGDEFLIVFHNATQETARVILDRIDQALKTVVLKIGNEVIALSISVGLSSLTQDSTVNGMISEADRRMYEDKKTKG